MFAFSLGPLSLEELEALEAKEKESKSERSRGKAQKPAAVRSKGKSVRQPAANKTSS